MSGSVFPSWYAHSIMNRRTSIPGKKRKFGPAKKRGPVKRKYRKFKQKGNTRKVRKSAVRSIRKQVTKRRYRSKQTRSLFLPNAKRPSATHREPYVNHISICGTQASRQLPICSAVRCERHTSVCCRTLYPFPQKCACGRDTRTPRRSGLHRLPRHFCLFVPLQRTC